MQVSLFKLFTKSVLKINGEAVKLSPDLHNPRQHRSSAATYQRPALPYSHTKCDIIFRPSTDRNGSLVSTMDRLKHYCIRVQYIVSVLTLLTYCICWYIDIYVFGFAFLILGAICMLQAVISIGLIVLDKKDITFWQRDAQLILGAMGLVALHAILLVVMRGINWAQLNLGQSRSIQRQIGKCRQPLQVY